MSKIVISSRIKIFIPSNLFQTPRAYNLINYLSPQVKEIHIVSSVIANNVGSLNFPSNVVVLYLFDLRKKNIQSFIIKLRFKIARILLIGFGIETYWALGYGVKEFLNATKNTKDETIFCFKEIGLLVGNKLIDDNKKVIFDVEDWYSEDLLEKDRKYRPLKILKVLEQKAITSANVMVPSIEMKQGLEKIYGMGNFHIYYNSFKQTKPTNYRNNPTDRIKLIWFSQMVSFGRGLEEFLQILSDLSISIHLDLIGRIDSKFEEFLNDKFEHFKQDHSFTLHGFVEDQQLNNYIQNADFGLGLEIATIPSRDLTITYKCFRYLMNNKPLILSNTKGQQEFANITSNLYPILDFKNEEEIKRSGQMLNRFLIEIKNNKNLYDDLVKSTEEISRNFDIDLMLNNLIEIS